MIVIYALDECDMDNDMRLVLQLLPRLQGTKAVRLRVFLTSRPEWPIFQEFSKITRREHEELILHQIPEPVIEHDISLFLKHRLSALRMDRSLPIDWPGDANFQIWLHCPFHCLFSPLRYAVYLNTPNGTQWKVSMRFLYIEMMDLN